VKLTATITLKGDPNRTQEYRGYVNRLLDEEGDGVSYSELHTAETLEYRLKLHGGIPFPPFVTTSQAFPELSVEVAWTDPDEGRGGRAIIEGGILREQAAQTHAPAGERLLDVRANAGGRLLLAVCCERWRDGWHGYSISADQHAFFRVAGTDGACELSASDGIEPEWAERWTIHSTKDGYAELVPPEPIAENELRELDRIAQEFSQDWIWFEESPLEETAVERQRFASYGYSVRAANLRSEALRKVLRPENGGFAYSAFGENTRWIPDLLRRCWLRLSV
jgi:hypothetical protein